MSAPESAGLDLTSYARRIGFDSEHTLRRQSLASLHRAHGEAIAFENFDVLLKRSMSLDVAALAQKLITDGRGGYCFETNLLLQAALRQLGYNVRPLAARVLYRATRTLPRSHMLLLCTTTDGPSLVDVGFGGAGLLEPIPLIAGHMADQGLSRVRLDHDDALWRLSIEENGNWVTLYEFSLEHQTLPDLDMAHYYVSTHPASRFTQTLVCQRLSRDQRLILRNTDFIRQRIGQAPESTRLPDHRSVMRVLQHEFALVLPSGMDAMTYGRAF